MDGTKISLNDGSTLKDALDAGGISPQKDAIIGIVKDRDKEARETNSYWLNTTKGKLRIELLDTRIQDAWHEAVGQIAGLKARWSDGAAVAFGP
ncbi:MAG TPA: methanogenesis marker 3 protein, partial [Methanotrichaceae archaeon]|nr:methanogenesis marker 3 protein [Methanotrichaceae archaeon]